MCWDSVTEDKVSWRAYAIVLFDYTIYAVVALAAGRGHAHCHMPVLAAQLVAVAC